MGYISFTKHDAPGINNSGKNPCLCSCGGLRRIGLSRGGMDMPLSKCRNSVFCVKFLVFFLLGTICGIWLYRCLAELETLWLEPYCSLLGTASVFSACLAALRPLILAGLACIHPWGCRVVPLLIGVRGLLTVYSACAVLRAGLPPGGVILRGLVILPAFYWLCRRACDWRERESIVRGKKYGSCVRDL